MCRQRGQASVEGRLGRAVGRQGLHHQASPAVDAWGFIPWGSGGQGILTYRSHYYLGMTRPTDQKTTAIEKTACYSRFPRGRVHHAVRGHPGKHQGRAGGRGLGKKPLLWFRRERTVRQGKRVRIGWRMILVASGAWGVPSCQVPGLIRAGGQQPEVSEPNKGGCWGRGLCTGWCAFERYTPQGVFTISGN